MKLVRKITTTIAFLLIGTQANAALMLELSDGTTTIGLTDQNFMSTTPDINPASGAVSYMGGLNDWSINITTGFANPVVGNQFTDVLSLGSMNASGGAGSLTIKLTQTDYTKQTQFITRAGGTTFGNVSFATYLDANNDPFAMSTPLWESDPMNTAFSDSYSDVIDLTGDADGFYSLTLVATITHTDANQYTAFGYDIRVPEPTSLAIFGTGLLLMGFAARKHKLL